MDREVNATVDEAPELPEVVEKVLLFALDEAKEKLSQSGEVVPFTTLVVKENLFVESHPADSVEECFALARHTVEGARGAEAYAFAYDGFVETDAGEKDALIAEGGLPGEEKAYAVCYLYEKPQPDGPLEFEEEPAYVGQAPNFMAGLKEASQYSDDEIDDFYLEDEVDEELGEDE